MFGISRACLATVVLAGCDLVFPLEAPTADAPPTATVTGKLVRRRITNLPNGTPTSGDEPFPLASVSGEAEAGNLTNIPVVFEADGAFAFSIPTEGTPYRLITTIEGARVELQHDAPHLELAIPELDRADRMDVTMSTILTFPAISPGTTPAVMTTGVWTNSGVPPINPVTHAMDWKSAVSLAPFHNSPLLTTTDVLYYVSYSDQMDATGQRFTSLNQLLQTRIDMIDGAALTFAGPMTAVAYDHCIEVDAPRAQELTRVSRAGFNAAGADWILLAIPQPAIGEVGGQALAYDGTTFTDTTVKVPFHNPFPGTELFASIGIVLSHMIQHPDAVTGTAVLIGERDYVHIDQSGPSCSDKVAVGNHVGVPTNVTIGGTPIVNDGDEVPIKRDDDVVVAWDVSGPADWYEVTLYEIAVGTLSSTDILPISRVRSATPRVTFHQERLPANRYFMLNVSAHIGFPKAPMGDFVTRSYPSDELVMPSPVFRVSS